MKEILAHCKVVAGRLVWRNPEYLTINLPKFEGSSGILKVKKKWNKRSLNQNSLYWVWVGIIADYCGNTQEEMHTILKGLFAPKKEAKFGKKVYMIPRSTTTFSKGEMQEYMFYIQTEASQLGIVLPTPEDYMKGQFA